MLVVAAGADLAPAATPGLEECGGEYYSPGGAERVLHPCGNVPGPAGQPIARRDSPRCLNNVMAPAGHREQPPNARMSTWHRRSNTMIPQAQHRRRTDAKRSGDGIAPDRAVPRTISFGQPISGLARPAGPRLLDDGLPSGGRCRLLGVFAHPDDETFCAGTFARYAEQGAEIMVVSATRGQAGQIRDAAAGTRRTIAAAREAELRLACDRLGITTVRCLHHVDGTLADAEFSALVDEVAEVIREFRPDVVITFGPDAGYGHPDHVTISAVTTAACQRAACPGHRPGRTATGRCAGRPGCTTGTSRRATC